MSSFVLDALTPRLATLTRALQEDGSCVYPVDLGTCDCEGNVLDAVGVCGGDCTSDTDGDGVCDDEDECIGVLDAWGAQWSRRHLRMRLCRCT